MVWLAQDSIKTPRGVSRVEEEADPGHSDTGTFYSRLPSFQMSTPISKVGECGVTGRGCVLRGQPLGQKVKALLLGAPSHLRGRLSRHRAGLHPPIRHSSKDNSFPRFFHRAVVRITSLFSNYFPLLENPQPPFCLTHICWNILMSGRHRCQSLTQSSSRHPWFIMGWNVYAELVINYSWLDSPGAIFMIMRKKH